MLGACSTPQEPVPLPLDSDPVGTGTVVATRGDTITVLMDGKVVNIQLEGFAEEGAQVAAAVRKSPAHKGIAQFADPAAGTCDKR